MKRFTKRGLSLLLVLAVCISLLSGLSFVSNAATVEYVYGSYDDFTNVIYNWGNRGTTATFLSPNAEDYYEEKGISFEDLAAIEGSANTDATPSSPLYAELKEMMTEGMENTSYGDARYLFPFTDCQNSNTSLISSFYDGAEYSNVWDAGKTYNREHVWPKSKLTNTSPSATTKADSSDLMMLRPVSASLNSSRGNTAYGESEKYFYPNSSLGTTGYDIRGDVARTLLYGYVVWDNTAKMWGENGAIESLAILLAWMEADPVDTWEMGRNDSVESINGTRNVFVDYPELAFELFEQEVPEDMATPSTGVSYNVTAISSNTAKGSVKVAGNVINVYPATGYEFAGYKVTAGSANVTVQGNILIVSAAADCQITVDFKARESKAVIFMANGAQVDTMSTYAGNTITLPDGALATLDGYEFAGWTAEEITQETEDVPVFYAAGAEYAVTADTTLYALFTRMGEGGASGTNFVRYTGALTSGDYVITYNNVAMSTSKKNNKLLGTPVTPVNNMITAPDASIVWTITVSGDSASIYNKAVNYVYATSNNTNVTFPKEESGWNLVNGDGVYAFTNPTVTTRALAYNSSSNYFGNYVRGNYDENLTLYKMASTAGYYTTGNAVPVDQGTVEYRQGEELIETYITVEEALLVATGGTVILTEDMVAGNVIVKPGVTLDLSGNTLTADLLIAMDGAVVTDSKNCGSLTIVKENLILAEDNGNVIPVWNGEDGYIFTEVSYQQMTKDLGQGAVSYMFLPSFSNAEAAALLADGGADNALKLKVSLVWNNGRSRQFYTYEDTFVEQVFASNGALAFSLTITGIAGITDMTASAAMATDSGAQATAAAAAVVTG